MSTKTATKTAEPAEEKVEPTNVVPIAEYQMLAKGKDGPSSLIVGDLAEFDGAGISTDSRDFLLPFLYVAQSNSPQLKRQQADKYITGLEAGDIFNTATGQFWKGSEGLEVLAVWFQKAEVEWITRKAGGGYVATHDIDSPITKQVRVDPADPRVRLVSKDHQLVETAYHFVINCEDASPVVLALASSGLQVSRQWQTLMKQFKLKGPNGLVIAPSFSRKYRLRTVYRTNDQGDWFQFVVEDLGWINEEVMGAYEAAKSFYRDAKEAGGIQMGRPPMSDGDNGLVDATVADEGGSEPPI